MNIPILITAVSGGGVGRQCTKALRLGKNKYYIVATDIIPTSLGLFKDIDKAYLVPKATAANYIPGLLEICKKEKIRVLIPGSEIELNEIAKSKNRFEDIGVLVLTNNPKVVDICLDKWKTYQFLLENNFSVPQSIILNGLQDINDSIQYPVVIKPYVGSGGSKGVYLAQNKVELKFFADHLLKQGASPMVQEYVGSADDEYTVSVLHSLSGELLGSFALKRLVKAALSIKLSVKDYQDPSKEYVISTGISQGTVDDYPIVRSACEKIATALHSTGPLNIQCRLVGKTVTVFEINPRFSGTSSIRALCDYNEVETLIDLHLLKKNIGPMSYKKGVVLRDLDNCYLAPAEIDKLSSQGYLNR